MYGTTGGTEISIQAISSDGKSALIGVWTGIFVSGGSIHCVTEAWNLSKSLEYCNFFKNIRTATVFSVQHGFWISHQKLKNAWFIHFRSQSPMCYFSSFDYFWFLKLESRFFLRCQSLRRAVIYWWLVTGAKTSQNCLCACMISFSRGSWFLWHQHE